MIDFLGALPRGDFDAAAELLDPDLTWQGLQPRGAQRSS
jgi:hypothetical protein